MAWRRSRFERSRDEATCEENGLRQPTAVRGEAFERILLPTEGLDRPGRARVAVTVPNRP